MSPKNKGTHGRGSAPTHEPDEFVQRVNTFGDRIQPHLKKMAMVTALVMAGLVAFKVMGWRKVKNAQAATKVYIEAMQQVEGEVVEATDEEPKFQVERVKFSSEDEKTNASKAALGKVLGLGGAGLKDLAYSHQARLAMKAGEFDAAADAFRKASMSKAPEPVRLAALEGVGYALEAKALASDSPEARAAGLSEALNAFANIQPSVGGPMRDFSLYHQGRVLAAQGKTAEAIVKFKQVQEETPESSLQTTVAERLAALE